jgi:two-component system alkaline phosphatase synthesis response regulator PhoP
MTPVTTRRILLIDDEDDIREVAALTLETMGSYEVFTAANGFDAVRIAAEVGPDVVLLDVMMPEIDGPTTLALIRQTEATRDIPVIFMTAKVQGSDRRRLSELGASGIISKPFDPMTLADEVSSILERHSERANGVAAPGGQSPSPQVGERGTQWSQAPISAAAIEEAMTDDHVVSAPKTGLTAAAKEEFLRSLEKRLRRLEGELATIVGTTGGQLTAVLLEFHNLAGIAGTYGFPEVTTLAREGEILIRRALSEARAIDAAEAAHARLLVSRMDAARSFATV